MKMHKAFWVGVLALALALPLSVASAGTTGKVMGRVLDDKGAPLPGASVILEGAKRGAVTGADGGYFILNVDPGAYFLSASLIGYTKVTQRDVRVSVDYTTTVDFRLKEEAVAAAEVVVTAERPPVEVDKTSSKYLLSAEDIAQTPIIKTTGELISLQPGVNMTGNFSVRGSDAGYGVTPITYGSNNSRGNDVYVTIDGVRVSNNDGHSAILFTGVNKSAVQQISIETGVTSAEYGDAQAGTVNIVTKEGAQKLHGWTEFQYEPATQRHWGTNVYDSPLNLGHMQWNNADWLKETDPLTGRLIHQREDYTGVSGYRLEGSLSGPLGPNASFLASLKHVSQAETFPSATSHGFYNDRGQYINAPDNIQGSASLSFKPSANIKLKAGLVLQRYTAFNDEVNEYGYADEGFIRGTRFLFRNLFLPKNWSSSGKYRFQESLAYLTFTHTLSPRTFYEVRIARGQTKQDTLNVPLWTENPRRDQANWYSIDRQVAMWVQSERGRWNVKADLSSQVTKGNFVKAGVEAMRYNAYYTYWASQSKSDEWFTFYSGGDTPWLMGNPATPIRGAVYAQDKMEFQGLIVNAGVRLDFNIHTHKEVLRSGTVWAPMWRSYTTRHYAYGVGSAGDVVKDPTNFADTPPSQWYVSPRLGISHPVTSRMVMHFSLGKYIQWIDLFEIYAKSYRNYGALGPDGSPLWGTDTNGNGKMDPAEYLNNMQTHYSGIGGDPLAHPPETLTFEVGTDWNFVSDYTASLTTFYRAMTQQIGTGNQTWIGPKGGAYYTRGQENSAAAYAKGVELALGKRLSHNFSFRVAWSSMWTSDGFMGLTQYGVYTLPDSNFIASGKFWYDFKGNPDGSQTGVPLTAKEIDDLGHSAQGSVRSYTNSYRDDLITYFGKTPGYENDAIYQRLNSLGGAGYGVMRYTERTGGVLGQANVQIIVNTPSGVRLGPRWLGWLFSDFNANVLYKLRTGGRFTWSPPGLDQRTSRGPVNSVTDLSVEKVVNSKGRVRPSFYLEVRNLFNEQERTTAGADYQRWGLQLARPDNSDYVNYGDVNDRSYFNTPRIVNLGVRVNF